MLLHSHPDLEYHAQWEISRDKLFSSVKAGHPNDQSSKPLDGRVANSHKGNLLQPLASLPRADCGPELTEASLSSPCKQLSQGATSKDSQGPNISQPEHSLIPSKGEKRAIGVSFLDCSFLINMPGPFIAHNSLLSKHLHVGPSQHVLGHLTKW